MHRRRAVSMALVKTGERRGAGTVALCAVSHPHRARSRQSPPSGTSSPDSLSRCVCSFTSCRRPGDRIVALIACLAAIGSKETALDYTRAPVSVRSRLSTPKSLREPVALFWRQLPFWLIAVGVVALRLLLFGHLSNAPVEIGLVPWNGQINSTRCLPFVPFSTAVNDWQMIVIAAIYLVLLLVFRKRNVVVFGLLWVPLSLAITIPFPPQGRYFFTPSIGVALAFGSILAQPLSGHLPSVEWTRWVRVGAFAVLALILANFLVAGMANANQYRNLGATTQNFVRQLQRIHPTFPKNSQLTFIGLPAPVGSGTLFIWPAHLQYALQFAYADRSLQATTAQVFPTSFTDLDRTFFFDYGKGQITEHADLVLAQKDRQHCGDVTPRRDCVEVSKRCAGLGAVEPD